MVLQLWSEECMALVIALGTVAAQMIQRLYACLTWKADTP